MIIGIDPGQTGALAVLSGGGAYLDLVFDMPVTTRLSGKGKEVNAYLLADFLLEMKQQGTEELKAVVERVHAMPGQGSTSMFNFGRSLGVIEGVLSGLNIPVQWVTPQAWKKKFGLIKKEKDAARALVLSMYPERSDLFSRKKDGGRADATLIGLYGGKT